ncbi:hypothetical protein PF005_g22113 [Phytophthora fragariae]|uniref:Uncharacterized protein n=2 Tax=Phytophthora TaxID=4783 RepID=A0A6A4CAQ6_9STRA|nr:hypothetical protein PF003_g39257 [Phytophthora fragariae]KAE8990950.1 hypothetical protein PR002_g21002 [Phytophthora rubi]KAE8926920.1 hypothetical protein PF009_g22901 [Phytophthora fragariae]KAE8984303.1 hypothetical protein PF011_g20830 [Phytophthora fragariae]KAE9082524.1 hypothetical protein PF007_g22262 [Phytophthora fragariae]
MTSSSHRIPPEAASAGWARVQAKPGSASLQGNASAIWIACQDYNRTFRLDISTAEAPNE